MSYPRISKRRAKAAGWAIVRTRRLGTSERRYFPNSDWVTEVKWRVQGDVFVTGSRVTLWGC